MVAVVAAVLGVPRTFAKDGEITYTGTNTQIYGDDGHGGSPKGPFNIGFTFNYYGTDYTQVNVNINGVLTFGSYYTEFTNGALSSSGQNNSIYAFWDDLITGLDYTTASAPKPIYYATIGTAPNRKFILQWTNMYFYGTSIQMGTFMAILYEGSNDIQIQYRDLLGGAQAFGNSATIGIKKDNTTNSQYSNNTTSLTEGQAIRYSSNGAGGYTVNTNATYDLVYLAPSGAPASPTLVNPPDGSTGVTTTPTFEWLPVDRASSYTVLVSTVANFSSTVVNTSGITGTSYTHGSPLSTSTQYYWRVQSVNSTGSSLSTTRSFTTGAANTAPNTPASVASANLIGGASISNPTGSTLTATLSDPDAGQQVRFRVQIASDASFNNLVVDYRSPFAAQGGVTYTVGETGGTYLVGSGGTVFTPRNYYLRIRAEDASSASSSWYTAAGVAFSVVSALQVQTLSPADDATGVSPTADLILTFNQTARAGTGTLTIKKSSDGSTVETITVSGALLSGNGTTQLTFNPVTILGDMTGYYVVWSANTFKGVNGVALAPVVSTTYWNFTTTDGSAPVISSVSATSASDGGTVAWSTNEFSSTRVQYGPTSALGYLTTESDTGGAGVTVHSVSLAGLPSCTTYYYRPISRDPAGNTATGSLYHFITTNCTNAAAVLQHTEGMIPSTGGTLDLSGGGSGITLSPASGYASHALALQIKKLQSSTVLTAAYSPGGTSLIGDLTFDLRAVSGAVSLVPSVNQPITVTVKYTDAQASGYLENTFTIYRFDGAGWTKLENCSQDTVANTVTCTTQRFLLVGLFGPPSATSASSPTAAVRTGGERSGSEASMAKKILEALELALERQHLVPYMQVGIPYVPASTEVHAAADQLLTPIQIAIQKRVCQRVVERLGSQPKVFGRANKRLLVQHGWSCSGQ